MKINAKRWVDHDREKTPSAESGQTHQWGVQFYSPPFSHGWILASLNQIEILLYLFLVLVSDRYGLSFYSYDAICSLLQITLDQYIEARDSLIRKDLIAFDGTRFQVLGLPELNAN